MNNVDERIGRQLAFSAAEMDCALKDEVEDLASKLRDRLARHLAKAVLTGCDHLRRENTQLRQQLKGGQQYIEKDVCSEVVPSNNTKPGEAFRGAPPDDTLKVVISQQQFSCHKDFTPKSEPSKDSFQIMRSCDLNSEKTKDSVATPKFLEKNSAASATKRAVTNLTNVSEFPEYMSARLQDPNLNSSNSMLMADSNLTTITKTDTWCGALVHSKRFEGFFHLLIAINIITMGIAAEQTARGHFSSSVDVAIAIADNLFTALFVVEVLLKLHVFGWRNFIPYLSKSKDVYWNCMDAVIVIFTGVLYFWLFPVIDFFLGGDLQSAGIVRALSLLRAFRLMKIVRILHHNQHFREAWLLLRGMTESARTLFWACAVTLMVTYLFAIMGVSLITEPLSKQRDLLDVNSERYKELTDLLDFYVGGVDLLMATLLQVQTLDSYNGLLRRIKKELPACWIYFYSYIAVAVFLLMNLVTAIIVENALEHAKSDEDQQLKERDKVKKKELSALADLFNSMDEDGNGTVNWNEFKCSFNNPEMMRKWRLLDFEPDECRELFSILDDGDGEISTNEFFEGLAKMKGLAQSKDIFRLEKRITAFCSATPGRRPSEVMASPLNSGPRRTAVRGRSKSPSVDNENGLHRDRSETIDSLPLSKKRGDVEDRSQTTEFLGTPTSTPSKQASAADFLSVFSSAWNEFSQKEPKLDHDAWPPSPLANGSIPEEPDEDARLTRASLVTRKMNYEGGKSPDDFGRKLI